MWEYRDAHDGAELSKRLKKAGFRFVGPTTVYAAMQATGIVNDHIAPTAGCATRSKPSAVRASLEDLLQAGEVLAELPLRLLRDDPAGEAGHVALRDDGQPRAASGRLELVCAR